MGYHFNEKENKKIDIRIIRLLANDNSCASDAYFNLARCWIRMGRLNEKEKKSFRKKIR